MKSQSQYDWLRDFNGCDGGEIGSPEKPSIWLCGIEWGGESMLEDIQEMVKTPYTGDPHVGYKKWQDVLKAPYNIKAAKLLAVVNGRKIEDYASFVEETQLFVDRAPSGHYKINLYPLCFPKAEWYWSTELAEATGFQSKLEYTQACRQHRFPAMHQWVETYRPRLIIGTGKTYKKDFNTAFSDGKDDFKREIIEDLQLEWKRNANGTILAVIPFLGYQSGLLNSDERLQKFGERLAQILAENP